MIYLEISAAEGIRRTTGGTPGPLLAGGSRARSTATLMTQRVPLYRSVATMRVNTNRRNPGAVVRYIADAPRQPGRTGLAAPTASATLASWTVVTDPCTDDRGTRRHRRPSASAQHEAEP